MSAGLVLDESREVRLARLINVIALFALIGVLAGSLHLQFGVGEEPCPLCLVQRSAMIGLAIGPLMNLLWGMRPAHYALSILAAVVGAAGSTRQILLHIATPGDPGYGPTVAGLHLYTWALVTFVVAIVGCAVLLLWNKPFEAHDSGVRHPRRAMRVLAFTAVIWIALDLVIIGFSVLPECGLGMCPDNPPAIQGVGDIAGWGLMIGIGILALSVAVAVVLNRRWRPNTPVETT